MRAGEFYRGVRRRGGSPGGPGAYFSALSISFGISGALGSTFLGGPLWLWGLFAAAVLIALFFALLWNHERYSFPRAAGSLLPWDSEEEPETPRRSSSVRASSRSIPRPSPRDLEIPPSSVLTVAEVPNLGDEPASAGLTRSHDLGLGSASLHTRGPPRSPSVEEDLPRVHWGFPSPPREPRVLSPEPGVSPRFVRERHRETSEEEDPPIPVARPGRGRGRERPETDDIDPTL